jgi:hypothetical protein
MLRVDQRVHDSRSVQWLARESGGRRKLFAGIAANVSWSNDAATEASPNNYDRDAFAEQAGRAKNEHGDQHEEREHVLVVCCRTASGSDR